MVTIHRRQLVGGSLATLLPVSAYSQDAGTHRLPVVVDASYDVSKYVPRLVDFGVKAVCRYYALDKQSSLPTKIITKQECDVIHGAGLAIGVAYQYYNDDLKSFTPARGRADALKALEYGTSVIGQPKGSTVFFGVDSDWPHDAEWRKVTAYFDAVKREFDNAANPFKIGVYGSGFSCDRLGKAGLASRFWLAKSIGYTGTKQFYNSGRWHLYQNSLETRVSGGRFDTDWVNWNGISGTDFFNKTGAVSIEESAAMFDRRRFVTHRTPLRSAARPGAPIVGTVGADENLFVVRSEGEFTLVIVNEDEGRQAYCPTAVLAPVRAMP